MRHRLLPAPCHTARGRFPGKSPSALTVCLTAPAVVARRHLPACLPAQVCTVPLVPPVTEMFRGTIPQSCSSLTYVMHVVQQRKMCTAGTVCGSTNAAKRPGQPNQLTALARQWRKLVAHDTTGTPLLPQLSPYPAHYSTQRAGWCSLTQWIELAPCRCTRTAAEHNRMREDELDPELHRPRN